MRAATIGRRTRTIVGLAATAVFMGGAAPAASAADDTYTCAFNGTANFTPAIPLGIASQGDYSFTGTGNCTQIDQDFLAGTDLIDNSGTFDISISSDGWYDNTDCSVGHAHGHGLSPSNKLSVTTVKKDPLGTSVPLPAGDEAVFSGVEYHATYSLGNGQLNIYAGMDLDGSSPLTTTAGTFHVSTNGGGDCVTTPLASAAIAGSFSIDAG